MKKKDFVNYMYRDFNYLSKLLEIRKACQIPKFLPIYFPTVFLLKKF